MKDKRKRDFLLGEHLLKRFKNSTNSSWQKWKKRDCWEFEITVIQNSLHWVVHDVILCSLCSLKKCQNRHPEVLRKYNTELIFSREIWTVCHRCWCEAIVMYAISIGCIYSCCLFIFRNSLKFYCNRMKPCNVQNLWNCRRPPSLSPLVQWFNRPILMIMPRTKAHKRVWISTWQQLAMDSLKVRYSTSK